jgi:hypothetical protein
LAPEIEGKSWQGLTLFMEFLTSNLISKQNHIQLLLGIVISDETHIWSNMSKFMGDYKSGYQKGI